jgi:hypothetical protein
VVRRRWRDAVESLIGLTVGVDAFADALAYRGSPRSPLSTSKQRGPVERSRELADGREFSAAVYVVSAHNDPRAAAAAGGGSPEAPPGRARRTIFLITEPNWRCSGPLL